MAETVEERLDSVWEHTDRIFAILAPDAWLAQPIALRHPFLFYLGHLPAFAWNHVCGEVLGRAPFNPRFDDLFSRGIDPDIEDPSQCHDHPEVPDRWPDLDEVLGYRDRVRAVVRASVGAVEDRGGSHVMAHGGRVFSMVIEHERMHQETLLYMLAQLPYEQKVRPLSMRPYVLGAGRRGSVVEIRPGVATLGRAFDDLAFGWDNEFGAAETFVPGFAIDATPVTNREFLAFVEAGGYHQPELWVDEDRRWMKREGLSHPVVWERQDGRWVYRALFDRLPLDAVGDWPVYVSLAEARAYARWRGRRLPTEAEFQRAAFGDPVGDERRVPWGSAPMGDRHGNVDFRHWAPTPVGTHPEGVGAWGVRDLVSDGWEWTDTPFAALPGFEAYIPGYPGYSADFFDGKHYVLKGASWATARELIRPSFRNWFQAHYPYVFAKFRCVEST